MSTNNNIDEIFRRGLDGQSQEVPEYVWDEISNKIHRHTLRRTIYFAAAASAALLISVGVAFFNNNKSVPTPIANEQSDTTITPKMHAAESLEQPALADSAVYCE